MIGLTDSLKAFLFNQQDRTPFVRVYFENTGEDADHGLFAFDFEVTDFVLRFGNITRELNLEHGIFRPGGNTLILKNSKDAGDYLFSIRKRFGETFWTDKTYHILYGFKQFPVAAGVVGALPKLATLGFGALASHVPGTPAVFGFGDTPSGNPSANIIEEEAVRLYTGDVQELQFDRISEELEIVSKDFYQRLVDFKACKKLSASTIFIPTDGTTDYREIQHMVKYGIHKVLTNQKALFSRSIPCSGMECIPNLVQAYTSAYRGQSYAAYHAFYLPLENGTKEPTTVFTGGNYITGAGYYLYYWDYIARVWRKMSSAYFDNGYIVIWRDSANKGLFFVFGGPKVGPSATDSWSQYIAGTGTYFNDPTKIDIAVVAEHADALVDHNPVRIIHDLLSSSRFAYLIKYMTDVLDYVSFISPDTTYSFDNAFSFFDTEGIEVNVVFTMETSLSKIIEAVCSLTGIQFFMAANKSLTTRHIIRTIVTKPHNPCTEAPPSLLEYSTKDRLTKYGTSINKDEYYDQVQGYSFDSSINTDGKLSLLTQGTGDKVLSLGGQQVYFYDCDVAALGILSRLYNKFKSPVEELTLAMDASGMPAEVGDFIKVDDHRLDESIVAQVYRHNFDLNNKTQISARRYTKLFGPDEGNLWKLYAFCGCAHAGTDAIAGSGADASITVGGTTITLGGAEVFDLSLLKVGMAIRLLSTMFWIKTITDTTHVEVDTAAVATLSNVSWSIGHSYHAR